ncbi:hypothetical protein [Sporosarcina sp. D27]|uniref:hypothetical protein n=1 Tax=Sporosarcina sp. D27 TaxID=1382305 RepID=UPI00046F6F45|nr:hypothetical protein [Sporosarcina sp. D27]
MDGEVKKKDVQEIDGIHIMVILGIVSVTSLLHLSDNIQWFLLVGYASVIIFFQKKVNLKRSLGFIAIGFGLVLLKMIYMKLNFW